MSKLFSVSVLGAFSHNNETRKVLEPYRKQRKQSKFIRDAIINFALDRGYELVKLGKESHPFHLRQIISRETWDKIHRLHVRGNIDYNFAIAFYWLSSLPDFKGYNKSKLIREIILSCS
jgi:hypothetical protein